VGDFYYAPPSGYLALCTANLPDPAIDPAKDDVPADYFNTVLYTGTGVDPLAITGVGFQPDAVWIKSRSNALSHNIYDAVRGVSKRLQTNLTNAESTVSGVKSFDSDGFTLGADTNDTNFTSGNTYVAWSWLAGNGTSSNTDGSITSTVSVNQKAGFSVVSYTGTGAAATVGHGLGVKPDVTIIKRRNAVVDWVVYTDIIDGSWDFLALNTTAAKGNTTVFSADADTFDFSASSNVANVNGADAIAYCFAEVEGYSKFGSYTGNGSTDGPFVYTGFEVAWLLIKRTSNTDHWFLWDNVRDAYNVSSKALLPSSSLAESSITGDELDLLSNGFKLRTTNAIANGSGETYIYMAFAENPFKYANAR
jgi:hypothetical protein